MLHNSNNNEPHTINSDKAANASGSQPPGASWLPGPRAPGARERRGRPAAAAVSRPDAHTHTCTHKLL